MGKWDFLRPYDAQVQSALAAGDVTQACEALLQGYQHVVVQYCIALLGNEADGEDVAQEVFEAIARASPAMSHRRSSAHGSFRLSATGVPHTGSALVQGETTRTHGRYEDCAPDPPSSPEASMWPSRTCTRRTNCTGWSAVCAGFPKEPRPPHAVLLRRAHVSGDGSTTANV